MPEEKPSSILIVDDNIKNLQILAEIIRKNDYRAATVKSGPEALTFVARKKPDLILLDIMMPEMDGIQVCRKLKENPAVADIPVIFISALADTDDKVKGFEVGGVDYVTKPFKKAEILARIETHLKLKFMREELESSYVKLRRAYEELEIAASTDSLTKLSNRRDMIEKIRYEKARSDRNKKAFTLVLADIDNFKQFNDRYGHDCGDFVLVTVARIITERIREQDTAARWGGEEFLFLLPETSVAGGKTLAENIQARLWAKTFHYENIKIKLSMTFGISSYSKGQSIDDCIKLADEAMYFGKKNGKNRITVAGEEDTAESISSKMQNRALDTWDIQKDSSVN